MGDAVLKFGRGDHGFEVHFGGGSSGTFAAFAHAHNQGMDFAQVAHEMGEAFTNGVNVALAVAQAAQGRQ